MSEDAAVLDQVVCMYHPDLAPQGRMFNPGDVAPSEADGWRDTPRDWVTGQPWDDQAAAGAPSSSVDRRLEVPPALEAPAPVAAPEPEMGSGAWLDGVLSGTVDEVTDDIREITDKALLAKLDAYEQHVGANRKGVAEAIMDRLEALS